jgi:hypothetical protein
MRRQIVGMIENFFGDIVLGILILSEKAKVALAAVLLWLIYRWVPVWRFITAPWRLVKQELYLMVARVSAKHDSGACNEENACKRCAIINSCLLVGKLASTESRI